jgi:hypothetical protein
LDGEFVRVRTAILEEPDGRFRALFYAVERPTTNFSAMVYRIADVLGEWRAAERRLADIDPNSPEGRKLQHDIDVLRAQYQQIAKATDRRANGAS